MPCKYSHTKIELRRLLSVGGVLGTSRAEHRSQLGARVPKLTSTLRAYLNYQSVALSGWQGMKYPMKFEVCFPCL